ncbi:hypothetical protein MTO96_049663 [Rhipicephalus appendiculatus]
MSGPRMSGTSAKLPEISSSNIDGSGNPTPEHRRWKWRWPTQRTAVAARAAGGPGQSAGPVNCPCQVAARLPFTSTRLPLAQSRLLMGNVIHFWLSRRKAPRCFARPRVRQLFCARPIAPPPRDAAL